MYKTQINKLFHQKYQPYEKVIFRIIMQNSFQNIKVKETLSCIEDIGREFI
jgi:hypothetical protein